MDYIVDMVSGHLVTIVDFMECSVMEKLVAEGIFCTLIFSIYYKGTSTINGIWDKNIKI